MHSRGAAGFGQGLFAVALSVLAGILLAVPGARAESPPVAHPVTATPPLQAVPATPVSQNVQQRMRGCNAAADAKKLQPTARETFIKTCMTPHRGRPTSRPGSQAKTDP